MSHGSTSAILALARDLEIRVRAQLTEGRRILALGMESGSEVDRFGYLADDVIHNYSSSVSLEELKDNYSTSERVAALEGILDKLKRILRSKGEEKKEERAVEKVIQDLEWLRGVKEGRFVEREGVTSVTVAGVHAHMLTDRGFPYRDLIERVRQDLKGYSKIIGKYSPLQKKVNDIFRKIEKMFEPLEGTMDRPDEFRRTMEKAIAMQSNGFVDSFKVADPFMGFGKDRWVDADGFILEPQIIPTLRSMSIAVNFTLSSLVDVVEQTVELENQLWDILEDVPVSLDATDQPFRAYIYNSSDYDDLLARAKFFEPVSGELHSDLFNNIITRLDKLQKALCFVGKQLTGHIPTY